MGVHPFMSPAYASLLMSAIYSVPCEAIQVSPTGVWVSTFTIMYTVLLIHLRQIRANCLRSRSEAHLSFVLDYIPERYFIRRIFLTISRKTGFQTSSYMRMIECIRFYSHRAYFHDCMGSKAPETKRIKAKRTISSWVL